MYCHIFVTPSDPKTPPRNTNRFNACRVPGQAEDRVRLYPPAGNHHVLVIRRNRFFVVHVADADGNPLSPRDIQRQLQAVIDQAGAPSESPAARPVGVLTSWGRAEWAAAREQLVADGNEDLLERAEAAALVVCLDEGAPERKADVARALWWVKCCFLFSFFKSQCGKTVWSPVLVFCPRATTGDLKVQHKHICRPVLVCAYIRARFFCRPNPSRATLVLLRI